MDDSEFESIVRGNVSHILVSLASKIVFLIDAALIDTPIRYYFFLITHGIKLCRIYNILPASFHTRKALAINLAPKSCTHTVFFPFSEMSAT